MTVGKGAAWGTTGPLPVDAVVVRTDAEARAVVERARRSGVDVPPLGLLGGDLCRTIGGRGDEAHLRGVDATHVPVDLGSVLVDGDRFWFVAHLVARRGWWRGRVVAAMNAQFHGRWDVAPRSHPGDGLLDVLDADRELGLGDRWKARARLPAGTHVPHPAIAERRRPSIDLVLSPPLPVWLDGDRLPAARRIEITVEPDALHCIV